MKLLLTFFCFITIINISKAQIILQGSVKDVSTGLPIPLASVTLKDNTQGTITNEDGAFIITAKTLPVTLTISHLSYESETIIVNKDAAIAIALKLKTTTLAEVTVSNPALTIMRLASERAAKTFKNSYYPQVFFRQLMMEDNKPTFFAESFMDAQWQMYGLTKYNFSNSRYIEQKGTITYKNLAAFSFLCSGYSNGALIHPINHNPDSVYKFTLKGTFKDKGHEIAIIGCEVKLTDFKKSVFVGDYYVDTENYNVLKTDGTISGFKMKASGIFNITVKELRIISQYKLDADSNSVLDFSVFTLKSNLKAGFVGVKPLAYTTKLVALSYNEPADKSKFMDVSITSLEQDQDRFKNIPYDANFWKKNDVIKRTAEEDVAVTALEKSKNVKGNLNN